MAEHTKIEYRGFTATISSDQIWMTVYDAYGEPCGTIERPHLRQPCWKAWAPTGQQVGPAACVGPRQALRVLGIYHGA